MSSILSNTDFSSSSSKAFHSFEGFAIVDIESPQTFNQENFGNDFHWRSENHEHIKDQTDLVEAADLYNYDIPASKPETSAQDFSQKSAAIILGKNKSLFGKSKSLIEFFYSEEKKVIKVDSFIVSLDDYEIF